MTDSSLYHPDDTIVAISTPIGPGGIGIVRLSGSEAQGIAARLFVPAGREGSQGLESHRLYYGHIMADAGRVVDEVLLAYMQAPRTYTREDVVEINAHGGIVPLREIVALCLAGGARLAHEGEFTLRAFLNGRIDLAQAEAVLDIIAARTDAALRVAVDQLGGRLSGVVRSIRRRLVEALAYLEASIDFPEDEIPPREVGQDLAWAEARLGELLQAANRGLIYRQGVRTAIIGRPNVGKSSLLNTLLRTERAIVTPIPGTTRDTLEEALDLAGIPFVLVDTAGIGETEDVIERLGIERSRRSVERADLVLLLLDGSVPPSEDDARVAELCAGRPAIVVLNKSDLPRAADYGPLCPTAPHVAVSALTGEGVPELEGLLVELVLSGRATTGDEQIVASNPRHRDLFRRAQEHAREAQRAWQAHLPVDLVAIDVAEAVHALGEVTGETAGEDLLNTIFHNFCIGK